MQFLEIDSTSISELKQPIARHLAAGTIVVLRQVQALRHFRQQLLKRAGEISKDSHFGTQLDEFYEVGTTPSIPALHALVVAIKLARDHRFLSECVAELIETMQFCSWVLLDGGINRLVLPKEVVEETRARTDLFVPTDYQRQRADGTPEIFMPKVSNIHRDFNRPHRLLQCNLWFPMHDADEDEIVQIYPEVYRQPVLDQENTQENRKRLGTPVRVGLRFGDAILFHGEHIHHSPEAAGRRHSYDLRIAAHCQDDNRHYRDNFSHLNNFVRADRLPPELTPCNLLPGVVAHHRAHGRQCSANFYRVCLENSTTLTNDAAQQLFQVFREYPFAEDRFLLLADRARTVSATLATKVVEHVSNQTNSYYFSLHCARRLRDWGELKLARTAFERTIEHARRSDPLPDLAPVTYQNPMTQTMPGDAARMAKDELTGLPAAGEGLVHSQAEVVG